MSRKAELVIFDIDGTLADISARRHHLEKRPKDWDAFFAAMREDAAVAPLVRLCNTLYDAGFHLLLCSGRPERYRDDTVAWLTREGVKYHALLLRRDDDRRSDVEVKRDLLAGFDKERIAFVVEDRTRVVDMWRAQGLVCLQCAPGEF